MWGFSWWRIMLAKVYLSVQYSLYQVCSLVNKAGEDLEDHVAMENMDCNNMARRDEKWKDMKEVGLVPSPHTDTQTLSLSDPSHASYQHSSDSTCILVQRRNGSLQGIIPVLPLLFEFPYSCTYGDQCERKAAERTIIPDDTTKPNTTLKTRFSLISHQSVHTVLSSPTCPPLSPSLLSLFMQHAS